MNRANSHRFSLFTTCGCRRKGSKKVTTTLYMLVNISKGREGEKEGREGGMKEKKGGGRKEERVGREERRTEESFKETDRRHLRLRGPTYRHQVHS